MIGWGLDFGRTTKEMQNAQNTKSAATFVVETLHDALLWCRRVVFVYLLRLGHVSGLVQLCDIRWFHP